MATQAPIAPSAYQCTANTQSIQGVYWDRGSPFSVLSDQVIGTNGSIFGRTAFNGEKLRSVVHYYRHSLALTQNNSVYVWGDNLQRELGLPFYNSIKTPRRINPSVYYRFRPFSGIGTPFIYYPIDGSYRDPTTRAGFYTASSLYLYCSGPGCASCFNTRNGQYYACDTTDPDLLFSIYTNPSTNRSSLRAWSSYGFMSGRGDFLANTPREEFTINWSTMAITNQYITRAIKAAAPDVCANSSSVHLMDVQTHACLGVFDNTRFDLPVVSLGACSLAAATQCFTVTNTTDGTYAINAVGARTAYSAVYTAIYTAQALQRLLTSYGGSALVDTTSSSALFGGDLSSVYETLQVTGSDGSMPRAMAYAAGAAQLYYPSVPELRYYTASAVPQCNTTSPVLRARGYYEHILQVHDDSTVCSIDTSAGTARFLPSTGYGVAAANTVDNVEAGLVWRNTTAFDALTGNALITAASDILYADYDQYAGALVSDSNQRMYPYSMTQCQFPKCSQFTSIARGRDGGVVMSDWSSSVGSGFSLIDWTPNLMTIYNSTHLQGETPAKVRCYQSTCAVISNRGSLFTYSNGSTPTLLYDNSQSSKVSVVDAYTIEQRVWIIFGNGSIITFPQMNITRTVGSCATATTMYVLENMPLILCSNGIMHQYNITTGVGAQLATAVGQAWTDNAQTMFYRASTTPFALRTYYRGTGSRRHLGIGNTGVGPVGITALAVPEVGATYTSVATNGKQTYFVTQDAQLKTKLWTCGVAGQVNPVAVTVPVTDCLDFIATIIDYDRAKNGGTGQCFSAVQNATLSLYGYGKNVPLAHWYNTQDITGTFTDPTVVANCPPLTTMLFCGNEGFGTPVITDSGLVMALAAQGTTWVLGNLKQSPTYTDDQFSYAITQTRARSVCDTVYGIETPVYDVSVVSRASINYYSGTKGSCVGEIHPDVLAYFYRLGSTLTTTTNATMGALAHADAALCPTPANYAQQITGTNLASYYYYLMYFNEFGCNVLSTNWDFQIAYWRVRNTASVRNDMQQYSSQTDNAFRLINCYGTVDIPASACAQYTDSSVGPFTGICQAYLTRLYGINYRDMGCQAEWSTLTFGQFKARLLFAQLNGLNATAVPSYLLTAIDNSTTPAVSTCFKWRTTYTCGSEKARVPYYGDCTVAFQNTASGFFMNQGVTSYSSGQSAVITTLAPSTMYLQNIDNATRFHITRNDSYGATICAGCFFPPSATTELQLLWSQETFPNNISNLAMWNLETPTLLGTRINNQDYPNNYVYECIDCTGDATFAQQYGQRFVGTTRSDSIYPNEQRWVPLDTPAGLSCMNYGFFADNSNVAAQCYNYLVARSGCPALTARQIAFYQRYAIGFLIRDLANNGCPTVDTCRTRSDSASTTPYYCIDVYATDLHCVNTFPFTLAQIDTFGGSSTGSVRSALAAALVPSFTSCNPVVTDACYGYRTGTVCATQFNTSCVAPCTGYLTIVDPYNNWPVLRFTQRGTLGLLDGISTNQLTISSYGDTRVNISIQPTPPNGPLYYVTQQAGSLTVNPTAPNQIFNVTAITPMQWQLRPLVDSTRGLAVCRIVPDECPSASTNDLVSIARLENFYVFAGANAVCAQYPFGSIANYTAACLNYAWAASGCTPSVLTAYQRSVFRSINYGSALALMQTCTLQPDACAAYNTDAAPINAACLQQLWNTAGCSATPLTTEQIAYFTSPTDAEEGLYSRVRAQVATCPTAAKCAAYTTANLKEHYCYQYTFAGVGCTRLISRQLINYYDTLSSWMDVWNDAVLYPMQIADVSRTQYCFGVSPVPVATYCPSSDGSTGPFSVACIVAIMQAGGCTSRDPVCRSDWTSGNHTLGSLKSMFQSQCTTLGLQPSSVTAYDTCVATSGQTGTKSLYRCGYVVSGSNSPTQCFGTTSSVVVIADTGRYLAAGYGLTYTTSQTPLIAHKTDWTLLKMTSHPASPQFFTMAPFSGGNFLGLCSSCLAGVSTAGGVTDPVLDFYMTDPNNANAQFQTAVSSNQLGIRLLGGGAPGGANYPFYECRSGTCTGNSAADAAYATRSSMFGGLQRSTSTFYAFDGAGIAACVEPRYNWTGAQSIQTACYSYLDSIAGCSSASGNSLSSLSSYYNSKPFYSLVFDARFCPTLSYCDARGLSAAANGPHPRYCYERWYNAACNGLGSPDPAQFVAWDQLNGIAARQAVIDSTNPQSTGDTCHVATAGSCMGTQSVSVCGQIQTLSCFGTGCQGYMIGTGSGDDLRMGYLFEDQGFSRYGLTAARALTPGRLRLDNVFRNTIKVVDITSSPQRAWTDVGDAFSDPQGSGSVWQADAINGYAFTLRSTLNSKYYVTHEPTTTLFMQLTAGTPSPPYLFRMFTQEECAAVPLTQVTDISSVCLQYVWTMSGCSGGPLNSTQLDRYRQLPWGVVMSTMQTCTLLPDVCPSSGNVTTNACYNYLWTHAGCSVGSRSDEIRSFYLALGLNQTVLASQLASCPTNAYCGAQTAAVQPYWCYQTRFAGLGCNQRLPLSILQSYASGAYSTLGAIDADLQSYTTDVSKSNVCIGPRPFKGQLCDNFQANPGTSVDMYCALYLLDKYGCPTRDPACQSGTWASKTYAELDAALAQACQNDVVPYPTSPFVYGSCTAPVYTGATRGSRGQYSCGFSTGGAAVACYGTNNPAAFISGETGAYLYADTAANYAQTGYVAVLGSRTSGGPTQFALKSVYGATDQFTIRIGNTSLASPCTSNCFVQDQVVTTDPSVNFRAGGSPTNWQASITTSTGLQIRSTNSGTGYLYDCTAAQCTGNSAFDNAAASSGKRVTLVGSSGASPRRLYLIDGVGLTECATHGWNDNQAGTSIACYTYLQTANGCGSAATNPQRNFYAQTKFGYAIFDAPYCTTLSYCNALADTATGPFPRYCYWNYIVTTNTNCQFSSFPPEASLKSYDTMTWQNAKSAALTYAQNTGNCAGGGGGGGGGI